MTTIAKRQKLHEFIDVANKQDIDMLLGYIERSMDPTDTYNKWDDPEFVAEMDRRVKALEDGTDKRYTWDEVKENAKKAAAKKAK